MITRLGIGIITRNRREIVLNTVNRVLRHTQYPHVLVVADDGSQDGTAQLLRSQHHKVVSGPQMGIAWNKNRALFYLVEIARCDVIILLEDDTAPNQDGWEQEWIIAAARYGHVGHTATIPRSAFQGGAGTADDPVRASETAAHCAAYAREAIAFAGFMDPRFAQNGFENVEHSVRLIQHGYGGTLVERGGQRHPIFLLLHGALTVSHPPSQVSPHIVAQNRTIAGAVIGDPAYRRPWRDEATLAQFRNELATVFPRIAMQLTWADRLNDASPAKAAS